MASGANPIPMTKRRQLRIVLIISNFCMPIKFTPSKIIGANTNETTIVQKENHTATNAVAIPRNRTRLNKMTPIKAK